MDNVIALPRKLSLPSPTTQALSEQSLAVSNEQHTGAMQAAQDPTREANETVRNGYTLNEAAELCDIPVQRLRSWVRRGFLTPAERHEGHHLLYSFSDLVSLRTAWALVREGVAPHQLRSSLEALRLSRPMIDQPLSQLRIIADGQRVLVRDEARVFEARSGQFVFDFSTLSSIGQRAETHSKNEASSRRKQDAYRWYLEGCLAEEHQGSPLEAERSFLKAVSLDERFVPAWIALGHIYYRRDDLVKAKAYYDRALQIDKNVPEAYYGIGCVLYEESDLHGAAGHFLQAIEIDPAFAEAHLNAAMSLEELRCPEAARVHWQSYIDLEPEGIWVDIARRHLASQP